MCARGPKTQTGSVQPRPSPDFNLILDQTDQQSMFDRSTVNV